MSATRAALVSAVTTRLQGLGYAMNNDEIEAIVNDVESTIVANSGTAIADCTADTGAFPPPPETLGG